jgi:hypothetical protein
LMSEIELALRALIVRALTPDEIVSAARRTLSSRYGSEENVPTSLEDMSFGNYQSLISYADYWKNFEPIFGGSLFRTTGKLKAINAIRNALFHFKRELTIQEHETLAYCRDWLLSKIRQADAHRRAKTKT